MKYISIELAKAQFTGNFQESYAVGEIYAMLDEVPVADVIKAKHGEWIDEEVDCGGIYGGIATQVITYCSECEEQCEYRTYFCPNCGADMREGEN